MYYRPTRFDEAETIQFKMPWDKNTARGFAVSIALVILCLLITPVIRIQPPREYRVTSNTIPLTILSFGKGDGTGVSKGNLSEEGMAHKGKNPATDISDAEVAAQTKASNTKSATDPNLSSNLVAKNVLSSDKTGQGRQSGSSSRDVGRLDGDIDGTGLGSRGSGPGKGLGLGDIEWGGGGNRIVLRKIIPSYPPGVQSQGQIKIQFTVMPDGSVSKMIPLQKADFRLEKAAMDALRQWRFNAIKNNIAMVGTITMTFKLR